MTESSTANTVRRILMSIAVLMMLIGGTFSLLQRGLSATSIMALSLASALILLDLAGKPESGSFRANFGFMMMAVAVGAAVVMLYERVAH
jgi:hypothetical protein